MAKKPLATDIYLIARGYYPCDGEERYCENCHKPARQVSAIYRVVGNHPTIDAGVGYWGTCIRCVECHLYVYFDEDGNEVRRVQLAKKEDKH